MTVITERASQPAWTAIKLRAWLLYFAAALFIHRTQAQPAGKVTFAGKGT